MSHAITIGGMLLVIGACVGLAGAVLGALTVFAGGMSDAPSVADATGKHGCIFAIISLALLVGCLAGMLL